MKNIPKIDVFNIIYISKAIRLKTNKNILLMKISD